MPGNKYSARPVVVDGIRFASQAEARRYGELKLLESAGEIKSLTLQPVYLLQDGFVHPTAGKVRPITYVGDFSYWVLQVGPVQVVEDVKGVLTPVFRLKQRLFLRKYPHIQLRIVK